MKMNSCGRFDSIRASFKVAVLVFFAAVCGGAAAQLELLGPPGSGQFGKTVTALPNGNFVVTDPGFDAPGPVTDVGAVYLYDGVTLAVISTLTGGTAGDQVGSGGVTVLSNGNFVVLSSSWNGARGAVTWGSGTIGVTGAVSAANSLVGSTVNDHVGSGRFADSSGINALANGNYVVCSPEWNNGGAAFAGAVTWGSGGSGVKGAVSAANSLVGSTGGDSIGMDVYGFGHGAVAVADGNYVVVAPFWGAGQGAVTWGNGTTGLTGPVSPANSLVGDIEDQVGFDGVVVLRNGNFVVRSSAWRASRGAVTWGSGPAGLTGLVSAANSLVGSTSGDRVGSSGLIPLDNGNYVVSSWEWDNGTAIDAGAVTWGNGASGVTGVVSESNSLVGGAGYDQVGDDGFVTALKNGNYVVCSPHWDNGSLLNAGAVTWGNGTIGVRGLVDAANSLVGSAFADNVGADGAVYVLSTGNYVVCSPYWHSSAGAVTWGDGTSGVRGEVSVANSLVGSLENSYIGGYGITALANGNYVVGSADWNDGRGAATWGNGSIGAKGIVSASNSLVGRNAGDSVGAYAVLALNNGNYVVTSGNASRGAVTWGSGMTGVKGEVSALNSLVGSIANDYVGDFRSVTALSNGDYVVRSPLWDNASAVDAGAVTWGSGTAGVIGAVSATNSLVGSTPNNRVGSGIVTASTRGNYIVTSPTWDNGTTPNVGAVTWCNGTSGAVGVVSAANSLIGTRADDGVGGGSVLAMTDGNYVVHSPNWDNGVLTNAGAVSLGNGLTGTRGAVGDGNSVAGTVAFRGTNVVSVYDPIHARLLVSESLNSRLSVFAYPTLLKARLNSRLFTFPNAYQLVLGDIAGGSEYAAYARAWEGASPALALADAATGGLLSTNFSVTSGSGALLLMNGSPASNDELRVASATGSPGGRYDVAVYPVVRPGQALSGELTVDDPGSTNRTAAVGSGRWQYDDYLLRGVASGDRLSIVVEASAFVPFVEVRLLSDESVQDYHDGSDYRLTVQGTALDPRDYLIRVTSRESGALGDYTLRVGRVLPGPEVWSFSPGSGVPGTKVLVRGTNFLDGQNPVVTGVEFGAAAANWGEPVALATSQEFEATVPSAAVSGPIRVLKAGGAAGTSTNAFIVLSPVGEIRRESGGGFSFAVSNAVAGIANVVERATELTPPVVWTPVATNVAGAGAWRFTNANPAAGPQQFYRVRRP